MLCSDKLTGQHNIEKILLKIFIFWEYIFIICIRNDPS